MVMGMVGGVCVLFNNLDEQKITLTFRVFLWHNILTVRQRVIYSVREHRRFYFSFEPVRFEKSIHACKANQKKKYVSVFCSCCNLQSRNTNRRIDKRQIWINHPKRSANSFFVCLVRVGGIVFFIQFSFVPLFLFGHIWRAVDWMSDTMLKKLEFTLTSTPNYSKT